jgi:hypothetical protein
MFAIRCLRQASGCDIDGVRYAHDAWHVTDALTESQSTAGQIDLDPATLTPHIHPMLEIIEIEPGDVQGNGREGYAFRGLPVSNSKAGDGEETSSVTPAPSTPDPSLPSSDDLDTLSRKDLEAIGSELGLTFKANDNKAAIIAAIRNARAED